LIVKKEKDRKIRNIVVDVLVSVKAVLKEDLKGIETVITQKFLLHKKPIKD